LNKIREVVHPKSVAAAWTARREKSDATRYLAGGIDVTLYTPPAVSTVIDLSALDLSSIREENAELVIGATATMTQVRESKAVLSLIGGFFSDVLANVASPLQRNLGTIGGTIASAHPWSDVIPALLVLDARLALYDGSERTIGLAEYLDDRSSNAVALITAVHIPRPESTVRAAYETFVRTTFDVSTLNCACLVDIVDEVCRSARLAVGGTPALARRVEEIETLLVGQRLTAGQIERVASAAADAVLVRDDARATSAYRRQLVRVGVSRCLERAASAGGKDGQ